MNIAEYRRLHVVFNKRHCLYIHIYMQLTSSFIGVNMLDIVKYNTKQPNKSRTPYRWNPQKLITQILYVHYVNAPMLFESCKWKWNKYIWKPNLHCAQRLYAKNRSHTWLVQWQYINSYIYNSRICLWGNCEGNITPILWLDRVST